MRVPPLLSRSRNVWSASIQPRRRACSAGTSASADAECIGAIQKAEQCPVCDAGVADLLEADTAATELHRHGKRVYKSGGRTLVYIPSVKPCDTPEIRAE
jgi:hypothetical protein